MALGITADVIITRQEQASLQASIATHMVRIDPNVTESGKTDLFARVAGFPEDYRQVGLLTTCIAVTAGIAIFFVIIA